MKKLFSTLLISLLLISFTSAFAFDNSKKEINLDKINSFEFDGKIITKFIKDYPKIQIKNTFGLGKTLFEGYLSQHDEVCGQDCQSTMEIKLTEDGVLVDDVIFETLQKDGSWIKQSVRNYQFSYWGQIDNYESQCVDLKEQCILEINGTQCYTPQKCSQVKIGSHEGWINYEVGEEVKAGVYTLKLNAEKKQSRTVDWYIETQGKTLESWAIWGGGFVGSEYQLILYADSINEAGLEINDVTVEEIRTGIFKINTTETDDDLSRAKVMKTLFYGVDGSNPRATSTYIANPTLVYSNDERDNNMRGYYSQMNTYRSAGYISGDVDQKNSNTTMWAYRYCNQGGNGCAANTHQFNGTTVLTMPYSSGDITNDYMGTTIFQEFLGANNSTLNGGSGSFGVSVNNRQIFLNEGNITFSWTETYCGTGCSNSWSYTNFYEDEGFPAFTYVEAQVTLNSPSDNHISDTNEVQFNCSANVTGGATLTNMSLWINDSGSWEIKETKTIHTEGLAAYYKLDETSGTNLFDELNLNNATLTGTMTVGQSGLIGNSVQSQNSDNTANYINIPAATLSGKSEWTLYFWYKETANTQSTTDPGLFTFGTDNYCLIRDNNKLVCNTNSLGESSTSITTNTDWNMLAVVYDGTKAEYFLNNVSKINHTTTYTFPASDIKLGKWSFHSFVDGYFDEVGLYGRVLTSSELTEFYSSGVGKKPFPTSSTQTFNRTLINPTLWTCQACDSDGDCGFAPENRTVSIDVSLPTIEVESPTGTLDYNYIGGSETLNITFTDSNLESCWYNYNGTNVSIDGCLTGVKNSTTFILEEDNYNMTIYANDSVGNLNSTFIEWNYLILEINQTFNSPVVELSTQNFELFAESGGSIIAVNLIYNGTTYFSDIVSLGSDLFQITSTIQIPSFDIDTNATFYFSMEMLSGEIINTTENIQEVGVLFIGNCTAYSNLILNLSLFDEKILTPIEGTIEAEVTILNSDGVSELTKKSAQFYNITNVPICSNINLTEGDYLYNLELRYYSDPTNTSAYLYVPEFYHIQKAETSNFPQNIDLYDLNVNESTEFTIFYRDDNYVAREDVLLQIQRKYVEEGIFRVIEIPTTSSEGSAVGHFDLNNYKYRIVVTKDGEVLNTFENIAVRCESELSGICEIRLKGLAGVPQADFTSDEINFYYTVNQTEDSIIISHAIPTGEPKSVRIVMTQTSPFKDATVICNISVLSSAGQVECEVNSTIGDSNVLIDIYSDKEIKNRLKVVFQEDLNSTFLLNNYFIAIILLMIIVMMVVSSPQLMVIASIFGLAFSGLVFLLKYETIGLAAGAMGWLIVVGIIILVKMNKKAEQ